MKASLVLKELRSSQKDKIKKRGRRPLFIIQISFECFFLLSMQDRALLDLHRNAPILVSFLEKKKFPIMDYIGRALVVFLPQGANTHNNRWVFR